MRYKDWIHQFFHHARVGDPYLGPVHKEATKYKITNHGSTTEEDPKDQLALQIYNLLVIVDTDQPGSPSRTRELWRPDRMPIIHPATYPAQQAQSQLSMATKTIARTLMQTTTQPDIAQQLSQPPEEPSGGTGGPGEPIPPRSDRLNLKEAQV